MTRPSAEALELSRARSGNEAAFERLVDPHRPELQVHCYRILGSFQDAEDMVQETLMAAWRGLDTFEGRASLRTWLYRIATNACLGVLRRTRPAREIPPPPEPPGDYPPASRTTAEPIWLEPYPDAWIDDLPGSVPGPEARYDSREAIELAFVVALQQLTPRERAAVVLKDALGFRAAETADLLHTTESAVNSALQRARDKLDRLSGDPHAADDVAQDVLLRLHRSLGELRVEGRLDAFAYRIARNAIIDHYRSRASARETPTQPDDLVTRIDAGGDSDQDSDGDGARRELARCLAPLIRQLPEPYREALTLTDLGKLSQVEAAEVVGLSVPGMKARVQRARAQVHELLTGCCEVALDKSRHIADVRRTGPCACSPE